MAAPTSAAAGGLPPPAGGAGDPAAPTGDAPKQERDADYYFDSYSHYGIHEAMLKDKVRTQAYKDAICRNKHLFKDKVVLDVGCGTGILSMFAASAGARLVIGVDCSGIIEQAREIVAENGLADKITLIQGKMEEISMPKGVEKVDIIISEWMGYFLLYESMLNTVLWARDHLLAEGGLLFPDKSTMYICGVEDESYRAESIEFWDDVYGFDFSAVKEVALLEPLVDVVHSHQVLTTHHPFYELDLNTVTVEELSFAKPFSVTCSRRENVHALVVYFDVDFPGHVVNTMTTSPMTTPTHWKQTVFYTCEVLKARKGDKICGTITAAPNELNHRDFDIRIDVDFQGKKHKTSFTQEYRLR